MHMLLALIAPRALYLDCASDDLWGDPKGCYVSLYNSMPVFKLLKVGFHIRDGVHNMLLKDWNFFMDFADAVWK